jgi:hypothetical protein
MTDRRRGIKGEYPSNTKEYLRDRARKIAYGEWQPMVPARGVRMHLNTLARNGIGYNAVKEATGLSLQTLVNIRMGRNKTVRKETADAIWGVSGDWNRFEPAGPTRELLDELASVGWTGPRLAEVLGYARSIRVRCERVRRSTAALVRELHWDIYAQDPNLRAVCKCKPLDSVDRDVLRTVAQGLGLVDQPTKSVPDVVQDEYRERQRRKEYHDRYYAENLERLRAEGRQRARERRADPEVRRREHEANRAWRKKNPERVRAYKKARREAGKGRAA